MDERAAADAVTVIGLRDELRTVIAERDRLRAALVDITEHASAIAEDDDGFVSIGYTVTVGAIHRGLAALQGTTHADPLSPLMPTGEHQVFRDWLDFVERVARPIGECDGASEEEAMALYRQANPFFICVGFVFAMNRIEAAEAERDRLREAIAADRPYQLASLKALMAERDRLRAVVRKLVHEAGIEITNDYLSYACDEYGGFHDFTPDELATYRAALDGSEVTDG